METPYRDALRQVKNKTLVPFNAYNTDVNVGVVPPSVACNVFAFGGTEYRNDRMIQMVSVPISRELYISKIQIFSYRVSGGGAASPFVDYSTNPTDNQNLVDYLTLYLCQNPVYTTTGAGTLADPLRVALSSGLISSFTIRFNDGYFTPEFDFPFFLSADDTMYVFIDNAFANPVAITYNDFHFYTRVTGVLGTKSRER